MTTRKSQKISKFISILMAFLIACIGLTVVPFAPQAHAVGENGTLTIQAENGDFTVYRLLYGENTGTTGQLKNASFDTTSIPTDFWREVNKQVTSDGFNTIDMTDPTTCEDWLVAQNERDSDALTTYLARLAIVHGTPCATLKANEAISLPSGYYLITSTMAHPVLAVVNSGENCVVISKHTTPIIAKQIKKITDENGTDTKATDAKIGDDITFQLVSTFPSNLAAFDKYEYRITDKSSESLMIDKDSVKVSVVAKDDKTKDLTDVADIKYSEDTHEMTTSFADIKEHLTDVDTPEKIVVTYMSRLTPVAMTGFANPTYNNAAVTFTSAPTGTGTSTAEAGSRVDSSGVASDLITATHIYTFAVNVHLTDKEDPSKDLVGATFTLQDKDGRYLTTDGTWSSEADDTKTFTTNDKGILNLVGVSSGQYTLTQASSVDGYVPMKENVSFTIDVNVSEGEENLAAEVTGGVAEIESIDPANGIIVMHVINEKEPVVPFMETGAPELPQQIAQMGAMISAGALIGVIALLAAMIYRRKSKKNL